MKKLGFACAALVITTALAACSSTTSPTPAGTSGGTSGTTGDSGTPTGDSGTAAGHNVTVGGTANAFSPATLTIKAGETVTWTWAGGSHTVTSGASCVSDNAYGTDGTLSAVGATFTHTYPTAGTFEYFCQPHCSFGMKGTIVVQ